MTVIFIGVAVTFIIFFFIVILDQVCFTVTEATYYQITNIHKYVSSLTLYNIICYNIFCYYLLYCSLNITSIICTQNKAISET